MIIPLPNYYKEEPDIPPPRKTDFLKIREYLNCENWKCQKCGSVMFGRVKYCVYCKAKGQM